MKQELINRIQPNCLLPFSYMVTWINNLEFQNEPADNLRALILAEPLREGDCPRFWLNPTQAAEFEKITVPEFQFTQSNLREVLQGIGQYVHGEPPISSFIIYFSL